MNLQDDRRNQGGGTERSGESNRSDRRAYRISRIVGSWGFVVAFLSTACAWILINVLWHPFPPYPTVMLAGLGAGVTTLTATYGPIILHAQQREAERHAQQARDVLAVLQEIRRTLDAGHREAPDEDRPDDAENTASRRGR